MKKLILIISILFISNCSKNVSEIDLLNKANPDGLYGKEISLKIKKSTMSISLVLKE